MQEKFSRRRLPHWDIPGATYFITTCLARSIPARGLVEVNRLRASLDRQPIPAGVAPDEWKSRQWKQLFGRIDHWLDREPAVRHLQDPRAAAEVVASLQHFAGIRYDLIAWVVMPSHLHWVFRPRDEWVASLGADADRHSPRERILHTLNVRTARECNKVLGKRGQFWQWESYDHCVRDKDELARIVDYIHANPVVARLVASPELYEFSSCRLHRERDSLSIAPPVRSDSGGNDGQAWQPTPRE